MKIIETPAGEPAVRHYVAIWCRTHGHEGWTNWHRVTSRPTLDAARQYVEDEKKRDGTLGGLLSPMPLPQYQFRDCVETTIETVDPNWSTAKKVERTRTRRRA